MAECRSVIGDLLASLTPDRFEDTVSLAGSAMDVRGYEDLKLTSGRALLERLGAAHR